MKRTVDRLYKNDSGSKKRHRSEPYSRASANIQEDKDDGAASVLLGGLDDIDEKERPWLDAMVDATFGQLSQTFPDFHYTLDSISSVKEQQVNGTSYEFELNVSNNGRIENCKLEIYSKSLEGTIKTTLTCNGTDYIIASKVTKTKSRRGYS